MADWQFAAPSSPAVDVNRVHAAPSPRRLPATRAHACKPYRSPHACSRSLRCALIDQLRRCSRRTTRAAPSMRVRRAMCSRHRPCCAAACS